QRRKKIAREPCLEQRRMTDKRYQKRKEQRTLNPCWFCPGAEESDGGKHCKRNGIIIGKPPDESPHIEPCSALCRAGRLHVEEKGAGRCEAVFCKNQKNRRGRNSNTSDKRPAH